MGDELDALGILSQRRNWIYESKKDCLKKEIDQLRDLFTAMDKDRELLENKIKNTQSLCEKKVCIAEKDLRQTQTRLRETETEAASLLESKQLEMESLQKEKDDAEVQKHQLREESEFYRGYTTFLEEKVCLLVGKLHEYHRELQKKTEEIVEARGRAVEELEWVKRNMLKLEESLVEFQKANAKVNSEKECLMKELQEMKGHDTRRSANGLADAEIKLHDATQTIKELEGKIRSLENDLEYANRRAESAASQIRDADAKLSELQEKARRIQDEFELVKEKNREYERDRNEADAGAQIREAAISVLRDRIDALENDLKKERNTKTARRMVGSDLETFTQVSPKLANGPEQRSCILEKILKSERNGNAEYAAAKLEAAKYQLQEAAQTIKRLRDKTLVLENDLRQERARSMTFNGYSCDALGVKKMKKLERAFAQAHEKYMQLHGEINEVQSKKENTAVIHSLDKEIAEKRHALHFTESLLQKAQLELEKVKTRTASLEEEKLRAMNETNRWIREAPLSSSMKSFDCGYLINDNDNDDDEKCRDLGLFEALATATTRSNSTNLASQTEPNAFIGRPSKSHISVQTEYHEFPSSPNKIYKEKERYLSGYGLLKQRS